MRASNLPSVIIEQRIFVIRGHKAMLDVHLAQLYGVPTKRLKEQVRRNKKRFPADFRIQLGEKEFGSSRSHFATSNDIRGGIHYKPFADSQGNVIINDQRRLYA